MQPMRIIINADDLGISPEVNASIFDLMARGRITSATLLANGPEVEAAAREAARHPACSFGVHLNLTQFRPLAPRPGLDSIMDDAGSFSGRFREIPLTASLREAIFAEWSAQVERLVSLGVEVSHFDSHHHVHTVPGLFRVLKRVQRRFAVRRVRATRNVYPADATPSRATLILKAGWNFALRHHYRTRTTDGFTAFGTFRSVAGARPAVLGRHASIELMTHPGSEGYESETRMLDDDWRERLGFPTELISYHDLRTP